MATLTIRVNMDNAAFEEGPSELAYILREIAFAADAAKPGETGTERDSNGNTVATWSISYR